MAKSRRPIPPDRIAISGTFYSAYGPRGLRPFNSIAELLAELDKGLKQLDAGQGRVIDFDEFLKECRRRHARKIKRRSRSRRK